jgi:outer membrane biosynthesis protein TonB
LRLRLRYAIFKDGLLDSNLRLNKLISVFFYVLSESLELEETVTVPTATKSSKEIRNSSPTADDDDELEVISPADEGRSTHAEAGQASDNASLDIAEIEADATKPEPAEEEPGRRKKKKKKKEHEEEEDGTKKKKKKKKKSKERGEKEEEEPADTVIDLSEIPNFRQFCSKNIDNAYCCLKT